MQKEIVAKHSTTHGLSGGKRHVNRLYSIWRNMKSRCYNPNTPKFNYHGGKGVRVCDEWQDYIGFHKWAIANGYSEDLTIDRINGSGNYEPENCRWATYKEQSYNSSANRIITYKGMSKPLGLWAEKLNMKYSTLKARIIDYGWPIEKAFTIPVRRRRASEIN